MSFFAHKRTSLSRTGEWVMVLTSLWFIGGLFLDGWAHNNVPELETFFTPWHAVFYSGYFAMVIGLLALTIGNKKKNRTWSESIPAGCEWTAIGSLIFLAGGIGDMTWHELFGVESDIEALHSPTHLVLATGMTMMLSSGFFSWWNKGERTRNGSFMDQLPMTLSVTFILGLFTFMTQYSHFADMLPAGIDRPREDFYPQALPMMGFMLHFAILMGGIFLIMQRGKPAFGFVTVIFALNVCAMTMMRGDTTLIIGAAFTGMIADFMLQRLYPLQKHLSHLRLFAFCVPAVFLIYYFSYIIFSTGTWWSIHMWLGSAFNAGIAGLLTSFLVWPPQENA